MIRAGMRLIDTSREKSVDIPVIGRRGLIAAGVGGAAAAGLSVFRAPAALAATGGLQQVQILMPTGDKTGYTDTYNLYQLLNGNPDKVVASPLSNPAPPPSGTQVPYTAIVLGAGQFYFGYGYGSTPTPVSVVLSAGYQAIIGMGPSTTVCCVGSSFPSAKVPNPTPPVGSLGAPFYGVFQITGNGATSDLITGCDITISGLRLAGQSSTIASNPAASGIQISNSTRVLLENLTFEYINGWMIDYEQPSKDAPISLDLRGIRGWYCAGGVKIDGNNQTVGASLVDCETAQLGVDSGPFAALDALCIHDAFDLTGANLNFSTSGNATYTAGTPPELVAAGHGFHIIGNVSNVWFSVINCGGYPYPNAGSGQCGLMIEDDSSGTPSRITVSHAVFQTWDVGFNLSGSGYDYTIDHCSVIQNQTNGGVIGAASAAMGGRVHIESCQFGSNGQNGAIQDPAGPAASWAVFDVHIRATSTSDPTDIAGTIRGCKFNTPIDTTIGQQGVQGSVYLDPTALGLFRSELNEFANKSDNYVGDNSKGALVQVVPVHLLSAP
jgi:hypothetical protein